MKPPKQRCKDCGKVTYERTVGTPVGSCPERDALHACHRYKVVNNE